MQEKQSYSIIAGQGRSGTTMLLDMLNLSPSTYCRNEPDYIATSPFQKLCNYRMVCRLDTEILNREWDNLVDWALDHMGELDPLIKHPKDFIHGYARGLRLTRVAQGNRWRHLTGRVIGE